VTGRSKAQLGAAAMAAVGVYWVAKGYFQRSHPAPVVAGLTGTGLMLVGGLWLVGAFFTLRRAAKLSSAPQPSGTRVHLSRGDRIAFRVLGVPLIFIGLGVLGLGLGPSGMQTNRRCGTA